MNKCKILLSVAILLVVQVLFLSGAWAANITRVDIVPNTLQKKSSGKWVTCYIEIHSGESYTWSHGFIPKDNLGHPGATIVNRGEWFTYTSDDLMSLNNGLLWPDEPKTKVNSNTPEIITGIRLGGNGWDFRGQIDNVKLEGVVNGISTGNLLLNGDFSQGFDNWVKSSSSRNGTASLQIVSESPQYTDVLDYSITGSGSDGSMASVVQSLFIDVRDFTSLTMSIEGKVVSNSLTNSGWWWTVNGGHGELPLHIWVSYLSEMENESENIDISTVRLLDDIPAITDTKYEWVTAEESYLFDYDDDGIVEYMVKFDRQELIKLLSDVDGDTLVPLKVTGKLSDGTSFSGIDTIRVIEQRKGK